MKTKGNTAGNTAVSFAKAAGESAYRNRRRIATASAMMLAGVLGYYAVAGDNGLTVYKQKRVENRELAKEIEQLKQENTQLQAHVERLKSDPDAIEHEAREKLHYTRPGEVIYTLRDAPDGHPAGAGSPQTPDAKAQPGR